jgi:hypothetical protein
MLIDCSTDSETQPRQSYNMTYHQTNHGPGSIHTTTTQKLNLSSSLLNTPFVPAGQQPNKKKFRCTWEGCTRSFDSPHNVKQHVREAHTGEKPHVCNACWANGVRSAFTRPFGLTRHMQQVHDVDTRPSRAVASSAARAFGGVGAGAGAGASRQADSSQTIENNEFAEMGALLTNANAEMGGVMSDVQFQFDADLSSADVSDDQNGGVVACGECGFSAMNREEILTHLHAIHGVRNSRYCSCSICTTMFITSEEAAMDHAVLLFNGGFHVDRDANSSQEGPDANIDPALLSLSYP